MFKVRMFTAVFAAQIFNFTTLLSYLYQNFELETIIIPYVEVPLHWFTF